jgi:predicted phage-related endonuclease
MSRFILSEHPQGTDEWKAARAGKATGSRAGDILAKIKSGEAAARRDYRVQLVTERLTGIPADDGFISKEMIWGTEQEPYMRMAYEAQTGRLVEEAGFCYLPTIQAGCSVDGFPGEEGLLEGKCPKTATHIKYLQEKRLPPEYVPQVTHNLWITGRAWADFVSFDPRLPENLRLLIVRVPRDEVAIRAHELEVLTFLAEVDQLEADLRKRAA